MPRIVGVDIPNEKKTYISLQYIHGIGKKSALELCQRLGLDPHRSEVPKQVTQLPRPVSGRGFEPFESDHRHRLTIHALRCMRRPGDFIW